MINTTHRVNRRDIVLYDYLGTYLCDEVWHTICRDRRLEVMSGGMAIQGIKSYTSTPDFCLEALRSHD